MKKLIFVLFYNIVILFPIFSMADQSSGSNYNHGSTNLISILPLLILGFIALIIFVEILIGKAIGTRLSKETGLILGIVLIVLCVPIIIGICVIIYSNKNKGELNLPTANININKGEKINNFKKFVGKNYKDILQENELDEYINIFTENKLTEIEIITELTDSDLEKIGIKILGDRKKILKIFSII